MKQSNLSIEDFKRFIPRVKCINLFHYNLLGPRKLSEVCNVIAKEFESVEEMENLSDTNLVWYVNGEGSRVMWDAPGATNISLSGLARQYIDNPSIMDEKLVETLDSLKQGLKKNIELICVYDSSLGADVLVDGVYRGLALYCLYLTEPAMLSDMMDSAFAISMVTLSSPAGSLLFPCDFINICRDHKRTD